MAAHFNRPGFEMFDYDVYALCGDGCMMEGVSGEAASLAGAPEARQPVLDLRQQPDHHRRAHRSGPSAKTWPRGSSPTAGTSPASATPTIWTCSSGPSKTFKQHDATGRRSIIVDSHIAYGSPNKQDTHAAHGEPLGEEEIRLTKQNYGWPEDAKFLVPDGVCEHFQHGIGKRGGDAPRSVDGEVRATTRPSIPSWPISSIACSTASCPTAGTRTCRRFPADAKGMAGRDASGKVLNALAKNVPWLIGGVRRPGAVDEDPLDVRRTPATSRPTSLRRPQPPLRRPRTRDGRDAQRHGAVQGARRTAPAS